MSLQYLKRFADINDLKLIDETILLTFFDNFRPCLEKYGFDFQLDENGKPDYGKLNSILVSPPEDIDEKMIEALFIIHEISHFNQFQILHDRAVHINLKIHDKITSKELALLLWINDREFLIDAHADLLIIQSKSFNYYGSSQIPDDNFTSPEQTIIDALKSDMNDWFKKGKGGVYSIKLIPDANEKKVYFLIIHGKPMNKAAAVKDGKSETIVYRPEASQIIVYNYQDNILSIKKGAGKKETEMYLNNIGNRLFSDKEYFSSDGIYTLEPLFKDKQNALSCGDIDGLLGVKLIELRINHKNTNGDKDTHKSGDIFASSLMRGRLEDVSKTPEKLIGVTFSMKFKHSDRWRNVKISLPNNAVFDRKEDSHIVELWMRARGFMTNTLQKQIDDLKELINDPAMA